MSTFPNIWIFAPKMAIGEKCSCKMRFFEWFSNIVMRGQFPLQPNPSSFLLISVHGTPNDKKRRRQKSATSAAFSKKRVIRSPGKKRGKWGLWRCMPNYPANNPKCSSQSHTITNQKMIEENKKIYLRTKIFEFSRQNIFCSAF